MFSMSGVSVAAIVILTLIIVILALVLIKQLRPTSALAVAETEVLAWIDGELKAFGSVAEAAAAAAEADLKSPIATAKAEVAKVEIGIDTELSSMLGKVESKLLDTTGEDADIAAAKAYLARIVAETDAKIEASNAKKQAKAAALALHVAALTVTPVTGS